MFGKLAVGYARRVASRTARRPQRSTLTPLGSARRASAAFFGLLGALSLTTFAGVTARAPASAASTPNPSSSCEPYAVFPVSAGSYDVQTNEWNSGATQCVSTDGGPDFTVSQSAIRTTGPDPGAYPSIYRGCNWGTCTEGSGLPIEVADLTDPTVDWTTTQPHTGTYDVALDIWFNDSPYTSGAPHGSEMMVWLDATGGAHPAGQRNGSANLDGFRFSVWHDGSPGSDYVAYSLLGGRTSVSDFDLGPLVVDAESRGYIEPDAYLIAVEAGFELWQGGSGLATNFFSFEPGPSVNLAGFMGTAAAMIAAFLADPPRTG